MLIRYYGHVGQESGYGEAGNEICMAILAAGYDLEISTTGDRLPERFLPLAHCVRDEEKLSPNPDILMVHTLPISCGGFLTSRKIREQIPKARCIAYTTWEGANAAPMKIVEPLSLFDAVWAPAPVAASAAAETPKASASRRVISLMLLSLIFPVPVVDRR